MKIDEKKYERQLIGRYRFLNSSQFGSSKDCVGTLNYCTGVGKTFTALLIRKELMRLDPSIHTVILVPNEQLLGQWNEVLSSFFLKKELVTVEVYTSHYIIENNIRIRTDLLIVDELHEFYTDTRYKLVDKTYIQYQKILGLTANFEDSKNRHKRMLDICPVIDTISEQEAIREGYISNYVEYNLGLEFTPEEKLKYDEYTNVISKHFPKFNGDLSLVQKCISGGKINGVKYTGIKVAIGWAIHRGWKPNLNLSDPNEAEIDALWNPGKVMGYAKQLMEAIRERKNLLYNSKTKVKTTVELLQRYKNIKSIVFSQSTSFADEVGRVCNDISPDSVVVYHSKLKTMMLPSESTGKLIKHGKVRLKRRALEHLKSGKAHSIITASSLDKGFDVEDLRLGITASGTQNFTQYNQRSGRVKRKELFNPDVIALIINLYIKDTKDYTWLVNRQSKSNNIVHWVENIDDISFRPKSNVEFSADEI